MAFKQHGRPEQSLFQSLRRKRNCGTSERFQGHPPGGQVFRLSSLGSARQTDAERNEARPREKMGLAPHRKGPQVTKKRILLLGPKLKAVSGVATHLNQVFGSSLANDFELIHFQVGREGKSEGKLALILRFVASPISLAWTLLSERPQVVHLNTSFDRKAFWRDLVYLFVARFFGKKIVYQVHGGDLPRVLFNNDPGKTKWVERALRKTDVVCLLSSEEMRAYSEFVPGVRLELIPNAIDMDPKVVVPSEPKTGPLRLVFVGRLAPAKGVAECVGALK